MEPLFLDVATARTLLYYGAIYAVVAGVAAWIYRDARERGVRHPAAWALATLVFTILPVLLYLFLRSREAPAPDPETEI